MKKQEMMDSSQLRPIPDLFVTSREAAVFFGVSEVTLWRWRQAGRLQHYRIGGRIKYKRQDLRELVSNGLIAATV